MGVAASWRQALGDRIPAALGQEIDFFEAQVALRKQGKIDEKVFAETRLRRGAYGQRYDNGQRHDGLRTQKLAYPALTKGPDTFWDAPGMMRIKVPYGGLNPEQMRALADVAEEYSDDICHVTTRQDIQLHFVQIDDGPDLFRRLAAVGITTREACGNSVRNVTACPLAGVCRTEAFDVTPYAKAVATYLMGHRDTQDFGRKFKIAFSGCAHEACALVSIHDLGGIAAVREGKRGFALYVAGGLGAVPHQAKLFQAFVPEAELLPMSRAICRVFARLGEKKARNKARLKFLVQKLGIDEFRRIVMDEYRTMPDDPAARTLFEEIPAFVESKPAEQVVQLSVPRPAGYDAWAATNVYDQRQAGHCVVTVTCPLGDLSSHQMRKLADLADRYAGGNARTTIEQNVVLRWVPRERLVPLYNELSALGLSQPGAGTIVDVTSCPGTDTCKLGIASSRGLAGELRERLAVKAATLDTAVRGLRVKVSGCFNSCGQHHVADIGFYGNSRNVGNYTVPHFQVMLGGKWRENGGSYALAMGAVPSKRIPELVNALTDRYVADRAGDETFQAWCGRVGKKQLKTLVDPFAPVPAHRDDASFYTDWGDPREFTIGDLGVGECAGEVVTLQQFGLSQAEAEAFEAQLLLDGGQYKAADERAYRAMLTAAKALVQVENLDVADGPAAIVDEFRHRLVEPKLFWDTYAADQFSRYLFARADGPDERFTRETAHKLVEEANLFIDAAYKCDLKMRQRNAPANQAVGVQVEQTATASPAAVAGAGGTTHEPA